MDASRECQRIVEMYKAGDAYVINDLPPLLDKMIYNIIYKYTRFMPLEDLYQVAWEGIMESIESYDLSKGVKFTTYVYNHIRYKCLNTLQKEDTVTKESLNKVVYNHETGESRTSLQDTLEDKESTESIFRAKMNEVTLYDWIDREYRGKTRDIIYLYLEGRQQWEIAQTTGVSKGYISNAIKRFKEKLILSKQIIIK